MGFSSRTLAQLAGTTAVAMAFSPLANAGGYAHPLLDPSTGATAYGARFALTLVNTTKDDGAGLRAKGFVVQLEDALKEPSEKVRLVVYPKENSTNMLVVAAVVPPKGFEALPIPVCAQQHSKVVGAWNITAKGDVVPRAVVANPEGSTKAACNATIAAARDEINQKLAEAQGQQQKPIAASPATPTVVAANSGAALVAKP